MKVFVVALKNCERRAKIEANLKSYHIDFEFFDAIDARKGLPEAYEPWVDRDLAKRRLLRPIKAGELGCALSHALIYKKIVGEQIPHSIILEDDAVIGEDFKYLIKERLLETQAGIDMAFLFHSQCRVIGDAQDLGRLQYHRVAFMPFGTVGYYCNLNVATALHKATQIISHTADFPIALEQKHHVVALAPCIIELAKVAPTITGRAFSNKKKALILYLCLGYFCNKRYYGSFWQYLKRYYFHRFYKSISGKNQRE